MNGYKPYSDGKRYKRRMIGVLICEDDVKFLTSRGKTQTEAEIHLMRSLLCASAECCGLYRVDDPKYGIDTVNESPDDEDVQHYGQTVHECSTHAQPIS